MIIFNCIEISCTEIRTLRLEQNKYCTSVIYFIGQKKTLKNIWGKEGNILFVKDNSQPENEKAKKKPWENRPGTYWKQITRALLSEQIYK